MQIELSIPLDSDGYLRRECPFCRKQFKVLIPEDERENLASRAIQDHLPEDLEVDTVDDEHVDQGTLVCPYCGQEHSVRAWWTQEQIEFFTQHARKIAHEIIQQTLGKSLRNLQRSSGGLISVEVETDFDALGEPIIAPDPDDMTLFALPCCERAIKIEDDWPGTIHCPYCGFPHARE